jgi:hypothetical protein
MGNLVNGAQTPLPPSASMAGDNDDSACHPLEPVGERENPIKDVSAR